MDTTNLMLSLIFGSLGMGFFMYGKNTGQFVPIGAGVLLMVVPYFIPNAIALVIVCLALSVVPFVVRESA
jgi:hypothetical protein